MPYHLFSLPRETYNITLYALIKADTEAQARNRLVADDALWTRDATYFGAVEQHERKSECDKKNGFIIWTT